MSWIKGAVVTKNPNRNAKIHGEISGYPVGSRFRSRMECSEAGVHAPLRAGIHGNGTDGCYSVVLSGGYEDDVDDGDLITYTGQGGRDTTGSKLDQLKGKTLWEGPQAADQTWTLGNKALKISATTKRPVRVIRGHSLNSRFAPSEGYRYDGLYEVVDAWRGPGRTGFMTCRFTFRRIPGQLPLPGVPIRKSAAMSVGSSTTGAGSPSVSKPTAPAGASNLSSTVHKRPRSSSMAASQPGPSKVAKTQASQAGPLRASYTPAPHSRVSLQMVEEVVRRRPQPAPKPVEKPKPLSAAERPGFLQSLAGMKRLNISSQVEDGDGDSDLSSSKWAAVQGRKKYENLHFKKRKVAE